MGKRHKKIEKMLRMCALSAFCLLFGGCSLAREDLQDVTGESEELWGVLVTVGEQEAQKKQEAELNQASFGSLQELEESFLAPTEVEGVRQEDGTYTFEGIQGSMIGIVDENEEGEATVRFVNSGDFTDVRANCDVSDEGEKRQIQATILASKGLTEPVYMNPVYQRSDGSVFVRLDRMGYLVNGVQSEGEIYSNSFSYETAKEVNGKKEVRTKEFEVSLKMAQPVKAVVLKEWNENDELLSSRELPLESDTVILQDDTAYVIVEEEMEGKESRRSLYNWDAQMAESGSLFHQINTEGRNGLITPQTLTFDKEK